MYSHQIQGCDKTPTGLCSGSDPKSWAAAILDANFGKSAVARAGGGGSHWKWMGNTVQHFCAAPDLVWLQLSHPHTWTVCALPVLACFVWGQRVQNEDAFRCKIKKNTTLHSFKAFKRGSNRSGFTPQGGPCGRPSLGTSNPRRCYFQTWMETQFQICW